jgi:hypothetical protein
MRGIYISIAFGFVAGLALALPARFRIVVGLFALAGITALGVAALWLIVRGFIKGISGGMSR